LIDLDLAPSGKTITKVDTAVAKDLEFKLQADFPCGRRGWLVFYAYNLAFLTMGDFLLFDV